MRKVGRAREAPPAGEAIALRRLRAVEEVLDVRWVAPDPYPRLEVRNPVHRTRYRVLFPLYPEESPAFCTCTDFARRGLGTCKHIEAGLGWLRRPENVAPPEDGPPRSPGIDPGRLWSEIDRRQRELRGGIPVDIRALARPGAALFERSDAGVERRPRGGAA